MLFRSDRKSTRLNSSHRCISYAVFCLKKKKKNKKKNRHQNQRRTTLRSRYYSLVTSGYVVLDCWHGTSPEPVYRCSSVRFPSLPHPPAAPLRPTPHVFPTP